MSLRMAQRHRFLLSGRVPILAFSLRDLCELGVSVVKEGFRILTAEAQRTQRRPREIQLRHYRRFRTLASRALVVIFTNPYFQFERRSE
jgi:hypothetical protein